MAKVDKKLKSKKCKQCGSEFIPYSSLARVCSPKCALAYTKAEKQKTLDKQHREIKKQHREKDRGWWIKKAQAAFNAYIRKRDEKQPCISCGRMHEGQYHAGHYRTVGAHPELRFEPLNCHRQCAPCNNHKSGNIVEYRINLLKKIGEESLEWLEGPHEPKKYTIEELKDIEKEYKQKLKQLNELP